MFAFRKVLVSLLVMTLYFGHTALANTDNRKWTFSDKTQLYASLEKYDPETKEAHLFIESSKEHLVKKLDDFSPIDQAWLLEWAEFSSELDRQAVKMAGEFKHFQTNGHYACDYYAYIPSHEKNEKLPMMIMFHPSGKARRVIKRLMKAAESTGMIIVSSPSFYNTQLKWKDNDDQMLSTMREMWSDIQVTIPHDPDKVFLGGSSGGAMVSYLYSGKIAYNWAGIWACGGWLGGRQNYGENYGSNMRIAMVNGKDDRAANRYIASDSKVLKKFNNTIEIFAFEGGHQIPDPVVQYKSFLWLLGQKAPRPTRTVNKLFKKDVK